MQRIIINRVVNRLIIQEKLTFKFMRFIIFILLCCRDAQRTGQRF